MKILKTFSIGSRPLTAARRNRRSEKGIALVITLIMLSVTLVMMVAFMALSRREGSSVNTTTDSAVAKQATDVALASAQAQIAANFLSGFNGFDSANAYNFGLIVSTNYINPAGFDNTIGANGAPYPTNVNYDHLRNSASPLTALQLCQNISNLWFLPRAPVFVQTNRPATGYDFRYYLDLNENGRFETNGMGPVFSGIVGEPYYDANGNTMANSNGAATTFNVGDPEWVGILEHPDQPHGPNNHFIARYAFMAAPVGNTLDVNYIHNQAQNPTLSSQDGYMRNQGVGSWEINLAAFLADLNTNEWGATSFPNNTYYSYNKPFNFGANSGYAFQDALALLKYRYNFLSLPSAGATLFNAPTVFARDQIDGYSDGPFQNTLSFTNSDIFPAPGDGDRIAGTKPWSGSDNPNHYFTPDDLLDGSKVGTGLNSFTNRLRTGGPLPDNTYSRYTFYRMMDKLGTDSSPEEGKLNLNYSNAVVTYTNKNGITLPVSVGVVTGAETNLVPWKPQDFFIAAADKLLRMYTTEWFKADPSNYLAAYYGFVHHGYIDATGLGVTNFPNYGMTNQIPSFGITNIPVMINGVFVYSPAINRLLQLAANLYDASTNGDYKLHSPGFNLPHVFRPIVERDEVYNLYIVGYTPLSSVNGPNTVNPANGPNPSVSDPQLNPPFTPEQITNYIKAYEPIVNPPGVLVNVYGVPWIIGAKKGLPNFNQLTLLTAAQVTRELELTRTSLDPATATYTTNQIYFIGLSNQLTATFWNSYSNNYPRRLVVYANARVTTVMTNEHGGRWPSTVNFVTNYIYNPGINAPWTGSKWPSPLGSPVDSSFLQFNWPYTVWNQTAYDTVNHIFPANPVWEPLSTQAQLDHFGIVITNTLQAYILDDDHVVDYVQLRDPIVAGDLNLTLADPPYPQPDGIHYQWSTNGYTSAPLLPYGVVNQITVSRDDLLAPPGGKWLPVPNVTGDISSKAEAANFNGFFADSFTYNGTLYHNTNYAQQAPYTPTRTVYTAYLLQANDPLVHYLGSDLNGQIGTYAQWGASKGFYNGIWNHSDDPLSQPLPTPPLSPIGGRYQPWGTKGQMNSMSLVDTNYWNLAYKDPLVWGSDYWDFPTNAYPTVGWIGRVHRGTPWQTVDLKSTNILYFAQYPGGTYVNVGSNTWAAWTGDIQRDLSGQYFDAANEAPLADRLLFDIFTTRFNDNAVRGSLPVNVGAGSLDGGLAAWSALFSGMEVLSNTLSRSGSTLVYGYTNLLINPAGTDLRNSPLAKIVASINATRANTNLFPYHGFQHAGDVLQAPALSEFSPYLNLGVNRNFLDYYYGIGDEAYEWLPQQMMGLVRGSEQRYVLYCYGQTLHPAPNGVVLNGPFFQLVTNYQVTAETAARAVIRVDNANTARPRVVVESYNVLPPN